MGCRNDIRLYGYNPRHCWSGNLNSRRGFKNTLGGLGGFFGADRVVSEATGGVFGTAEMVLDASEGYYVLPGWN